jgi:hypothetical protein
MNFFPKIKAQLNSIWATIFIAITIPSLLLSLGLFLHFWQGIPIGNLTRDPNAIAKIPSYTGFISQSGIFFWAASAAICLFCANVLPKNLINVEARQFLCLSGMLSLLLGLDDVFQFHEACFTVLGIPEKVVLASYAGFMLFILIKFKAFILNSNFILLAIALGFFGFSIVVDKFNLFGSYRHIMEDGSKLFGIVTWSSYYFNICTSTLQRDVAINNLK